MSRKSATINLHNINTTTTKTDKHDIRLRSLHPQEPSRVLTLCVATYTREAEDPQDELTIKAGETLYLDMSHEVNKDEKNGWYFASNERGQKGLVPSNFVNIKSSSNKHEESNNTLMLGQVEFTRDAEDQDELSVHVGDVLTIDMSHEVNKDESNGWYLAIDSSGKEGLVPSNFVKLDKSNTQRRSSMVRFMATMSRHAGEEDELSLQAGDVVFVDMAHEVNKDTKNGWYIAVNTETNERGLVPTFCLRSISENKPSSKEKTTSLPIKEQDKMMSPEKRLFPFQTRPERTISNFTIHDLDLYDELCERGWVILNLIHESSHRVEENDLLEVDYVGYVWDGSSSSIEMYIDTRSKKTPTWIEISNDSSCAVSGLVSALRMMRIGQTADLVISPQQA